MSAIFSQRFDRLARLAAATLLLLLVSGGVGLAWLLHPRRLDTGYMPAQPVPFSHKLHAGEVGLDCRYCHASVEQARYAAIPTTATCLNCHARVKEKSAKLRLVHESYAINEPLAWVKVHRLPDYAYFNHQAHFNAGVGCANCHGRVERMAEVRQEQPLSMAWCLECHRDPAAAHVRQAREKGLKPPEYCSACHR